MRHLRRGVKTFGALGEPGKATVDTIPLGFEIGRGGVTLWGLEIARDDATLVQFGMGLELERHLHIWRVLELSTSMRLGLGTILLRTEEVGD
jgi:hypothetical protein